MLRMLNGICKKIIKYSSIYVLITPRTSRLFLLRGAWHQFQAPSRRCALKTEEADIIHPINLSHSFIVHILRSTDSCCFLLFYVQLPFYFRESKLFGIRGVLTPTAVPRN